MINPFSDCIFKDPEPPVTLADGRHAVKLIEAVYHAVKAKIVVEVP